MASSHYVILGGAWDGVMFRSIFEKMIERVSVDGRGRKVVLKAPWWRMDAPEHDRTYHVDGNVAERWGDWAERFWLTMGEPFAREEASQAAHDYLQADLSRALDKVYGLDGDRASQGKSESRDSREVEEFLAIVFYGGDPR